MQHQDWQELIPFYIAKTLSPEEHRAFEQHLATCPTCHQQIREWRQIAAAVWSEADSAAQNVPALPQSVYAKLQYRGQALATRQETAPPTPDYVPRQAVAPQHRQASTQRNFSLPITMVAGIVVAFLFGGFLIMLTLREPTETLDNQVAVKATGTAEMFAAMQAASEESIASLTPVPTDSRNTTGIIPTPIPLMTDTVVPTAQPSPQQTVGIGGGGGNEFDTQPIQVNPTSAPPATDSGITSAQITAPDEGPYITLTPGLTDNGTFACYLINPTTVPIDAYAFNEFIAPIVAEVAPGARYRTLVRSLNGWYQIVVGPGQAVWVPPATAYLSGNCDASQFWIPTPTASAQPTAVATNSNGVLMPTSGDTSAVVDAAFANFYSGPGFDFETVNVTERGSTFQIVAYTIQNGDRWLQVLTPDGQLRWLWGEVVSEYNNNELPQNP